MNQNNQLEIWQKNVEKLLNGKPFNKWQNYESKENIEVSRFRNIFKVFNNDIFNKISITPLLWIPNQTILNEFNNHESRENYSSIYFEDQDENFNDKNFYIINLCQLHDQGANISLECGIFAQKLVTFLDDVTISKKTTLTKKKILLKTKCNSNFFHSIAKIKAIRIVFNFIIKKYEDFIKISNDQLEILITPSRRRHGLEFTEGNLIKNYYSLLAAGFGGANYLVNEAHDLNNISLDDCLLAYDNLILAMDEGNLFDIKDPAKGSHVVEDLIEKLINITFENYLFVDRDQFLSDKESLKLAKQLREQQIDLIDSSRSKIVGVTDFNVNEFNNDNLDFKDLLNFDGKHFEILRSKFRNLKVEFNIVYDFTKLSELRMRINFVVNLLNIFGIKVHFFDINSKEFNSKNIILVSSDQEYETLLLKHKTKLKNKNVLIANRDENLLNLFESNYKDNLYLNAPIYKKMLLLFEFIQKEK